MKAIVCHRYGAPEALRIEDVDKPTPGDGEVLIQVRAASLGGLLESRKVTTVIDSRHRLGETSEAFRRLAEEPARGKIVVTVNQNGSLAKI